jgi:hypothetical protein
MGEKAATNEVITKLVSALGDQYKLVRVRACQALGNIGERAATNEVITKFMTMCGIYDDMFYTALPTIDRILSSPTSIIRLGPKLISEFCLWPYRSNCLKNVPVDEVIRIFFGTKNSDWLLAVISIAHQRGAAVSINERTLVVCDNREPLELPIPSLKLHQELIEAFSGQAKQLHLSFEIPFNVRNKYKISSRLCNIL